MHENNLYQINTQVIKVLFSYIFLGEGREDLNLICLHSKYHTIPLNDKTLDNQNFSGSLLNCYLQFKQVNSILL